MQRGVENKDGDGEMPRSFAKRFSGEARLAVAFIPPPFASVEFVWACACLGGAKRRRLFQDRHTPNNHFE